MKKWYNTALFRILAPVFIISVIVIWQSEMIVEEMVVKHISKTVQKELESENNKLYAIAKNNYQILFFSRGSNREEFFELEPSVKDETLRDLKNEAKDLPYSAYIFDGSKYIPLNNYGENITLNGLVQPLESGRIGKNIYASKAFLPWGWSFITVYDNATIEEMIDENRRTISLIIATVSTLIGIVIIFVIYRAINLPFRRLFAHIDDIKNGKYEPIEIKKGDPEEIRSLSKHINGMSLSIKTKTEESQRLIEKLDEERGYTRTILDSQTSIVIVTNGREIIDCNSAFFDFFDSYSSLDEFKKEYKCVCSLFENYDDGEQQYLGKQEIDWVKKAMGIEQRALIQKNGSYKHFAVNSKRHELRENTVYVVTLDDITPLVLQKNELKKRLYTDQLTSLPNRTKLLLDMVGTESPVLFLINIDSFSQVNDLYGYKVGDQLLSLLAVKLNRAIALFEKVYKFDRKSTGWMLYKLSGDEYALLMPNAPIKNEQEKIAYSICHLIENSHFWCQGIDIEIKVTLGISDSDKIMLDDWDKPKNILSDADMALKKAKTEGFAFLFYNDEMNLKTDYIKNIECAKKLKNAIAEDRIVPYFQPILDITTGEIKKYEVLMRLIEGNGHVTGPLAFMDIAKSSKQYNKLTRIIISKSFEWFKDKPYEFSLNISYDDIADRDIRHFIFEMLKEYGIGDRVVFEILESEGIKNYDDVRLFVDEVRRFGCKCAIDDFGSGYSSFEHILRLKTEYLKIDGSIIKNIDKDSDAKAVAKAIVSFANDLGIKTVAEYVHSQEVMEMVRSLGISYAQGYYISPPKPTTD